MSNFFELLEQCIREGLITGVAVGVEYLELVEVAELFESHALAGASRDFALLGTTAHC